MEKLMEKLIQILKSTIQMQREVLDKTILLLEELNKIPVHKEISPREQLEGSETYYNQRDNKTLDQCMISSFCGRINDIGKMLKDDYLKNMNEEVYFEMFKNLKRFSSETHRNFWNEYFLSKGYKVRFNFKQFPNPVEVVKGIVTLMKSTNFDVITSSDSTWSGKKEDKNQGHIISIISYRENSDGTIDLLVHDSWGDYTKGYSPGSVGKSVWYNWKHLIGGVFKVQNTVTYLENSYYPIFLLFFFLPLGIFLKVFFCFTIMI